MSIYEWADNEYNIFKTNTGFTQKLASKTYELELDEYRKYEERLALIHEFQDICIHVFEDALDGGVNNKVLEWLINETPESLGIEYHKKLDRGLYKRPVFFRTDELNFGKIAEIQCPGSLWGELELCYKYLFELGIDIPISDPGHNFSLQLKEYIGEMPIIHHLLDAASAQPGMRYFISNIRKWNKFYGMDKDISAYNCNFVRGHSVFGLCADNYFKERVISKKIQYDLPPIILFDQKATLVLPFWSKTRDYFNDDIRNMIAYSVPVLKEGIEMEDGSIVSIKDFSARPRSSRNYYLKYAGADIALNWGSKGVYRLSNMNSKKCYEILMKCAEESLNGKIWLIQKEIIRDDIVEYYERDGRKICKTLRGKYSAFYGPYSLIGVLAMHRHHNKVHGQKETVISLGICKV
ncbi:hypothetical protein D7V82_18475 [bacterium 1xD8-6]|nr:hypothetical protein D7V72_21220 [bacterium D16-36]RKI64402.1 hypothetical protein D7V82_18475 [bacterium 1xD8-6]